MGRWLVGRYSAGLIADRLGSGRTLAPALASSTIGLVLFAINVDGGSTPVLFCAAVLFGLGFGAVQNESLVMAFQAAGPRQLGSASAIWNIGYDAGTGIGALALGFVATTAGYAWGLRGLRGRCRSAPGTGRGRQSDRQQGCPIELGHERFHDCCTRLRLRQPAFGYSRTGAQPGRRWR